MSEPRALLRRGRLLRIGAAAAVLLALAGYVVAQYVSGGRAAPRCKVVSGAGDGASYEFTAEQAANAATISAVGTSRGMPERAVTIALATALQESAMRNINHGDRDSLGLFQQRPSQGWGTAQEIMDPAYAAGRFYEHLAQVPGYSRLPLTVAAQRVQHSGFPQAYAKHEPDATLLSAALTGRVAGTLTCEGRSSAKPGDPVQVRAALVRDFGRNVLPADGTTVSPGTAGHGAAVHPGAGKDSGKAAAGSGDTARTVTVPVPAGSGSAQGGARQRGWELAHWAVAHSTALHIDRVSYAGRQWSVDSGEWSGADGGAAADEVRIVTAP
ncbi:heavy metal transporter [Streptomyces sp. NPDC002004]